MGIPSLFAYYYRKYKKEKELMTTIEDLRRSNIGHLFFDFNSLIHPCAQQILAANSERYLNETEETIEGEIIEHCIRYTKYIIYTLMCENKRVYIMIDGVAPRSKMNQQRERRYKSYFFRDLESVPKSKLWDSNRITPGTPFMKRMRDELSKWIRENSNYYLSDSDEPGEGEHKMMRVISGIKDDSKICIYGLDADLIMLSLLHSHADKIILVRDGPAPAGPTISPAPAGPTISPAPAGPTISPVPAGPTISPAPAGPTISPAPAGPISSAPAGPTISPVQAGTLQESANIEYLNIKSLKGYILDDILFKFRNENQQLKIFDPTNLIYDYILICFFLGNDFLDHLISIKIKENGIDTILRAYIRAYRGDFLVNISKLKTQETWLNSINLEFLKDIFYQLKNYEGYYLKNHTEKPTKIDINIIERNNASENKSVYFYNKNYIFNSKSFKRDYLAFYGVVSCSNYIEGLYWVLGYYSGHIHSNWSWYYKCHAVPLISDLFEFLKTNRNYMPDIKPDQPFTPLKQLCLVLPRDSLINLNLTNVTKLFDCDSTFVKDLFPTFLYADINDKEFLWQTKILFNQINEKLLDLFLS